MSRHFGNIPEENPKKKPAPAEPVEAQEETKSPIQNKAVLLLGIIPLIIAILFAIKAWPKNADKEQRDRTLCCHNLLAIQRIKDQVADEMELGGGEEIPDAVADGIIKCRMNLCPSGGKITIGVVGDEPRCSIHGAASGCDIPTDTGDMPP